MPCQIVYFSAISYATQLCARPCCPGHTDTLMALLARVLSCAALPCLLMPCPVLYYSYLACMNAKIAAICYLAVHLPRSVLFCPTDTPTLSRFQYSQHSRICSLISFPLIEDWQSTSNPVTLYVRARQHVQLQFACNVTQHQWYCAAPCYDALHLYMLS